MTKLKNVFRIIFSNFSTLILFELLYNILTFAVYSLLSNLLNMSMNNMKVQYFTQENLTDLFQNPISILTVVLILIVISFYLYIHYAALTIYFESRNQKIKLLPFLRQIISKFKRLRQPSNLLVLFFIVSFSLMQYLFYSPTVFKLVVPEFIMQVIVENKLILAIYIGLLIGLFLLFVCYAPALYYFFIQEKPIKTALNESRKRMKQGFLKNILQVIFSNVILWIFFYLIYLSLVFLLVLVFKYIVQDSNYFWMIFRRMQAIYRLLHPILLIAGTVFLLYTMAQVDKKEIAYPKEKKNYRVTGFIKILMIILLLMVFVEFSDPSVYNRIDYTNLKIIAHRAGGIFAPENTISGIQAAIESDSDYAEIDVQSTKDGILVLSHDPSLKRITGIDQEINNLTYEELSKIDVGMPYKPIFKGEKIPTLEDVLKFSKGKIKLVIELKGNNKNQELVQQTLELIRDNNMENDCIIASLQLDIIKQAKQMNKDIQTAYIVAFAYGDLLAIKEYVDVYAFEPSYVDEQVFHFLKGADKEIFVWTINKEKNINRMLSLPIDGIIIDNPYWTQYAIGAYNKDLVDQLLLDAFHS